MRPAIGIPLCLDARGRWRSGRDYVYADRAYAQAVECAGGLPLHLPVQDDAAALVARVDALLLPGGDDFLPPDGPEGAGYGADVVFDAAPEAQIAFDRALLAAALAREIPVLGLCYGMQLLALHGGGTLHYHLPADRPEAQEHRLPDAGRHAVRVEPGTRLAAILGFAERGGELCVNSRHHQAVAAPGAGQVAAAHARDGVIEAVERPGEPFCVGVQWHPESLDDRRLFDAFVAAASQRG